MEEENKEIEIRSDEVQEILSNTPNWMIRWGITVIMGLIVLVLFLSWFIKYPDVVRGTVVLTTSEPPNRLLSQRNGYIESLMIENDMSISKGDVIAEIKSPIRKATIDSLSYLLNHDISIERLIKGLNNLNGLGTLQADVNTLINKLGDYQDISSHDYYENRLKNLYDQISYNNQLASISKEELSLFDLEISNAKDKFVADSLLFVQGVIAKHSFYASQTEYITKKQRMINAKKSYVEHSITAANYEKQRIDLEKNFSDKKRQLETTIATTQKAIASAIENWQQNYVITAPIDGKVTYLSNLNRQEYVQAQQALFAIIPEKESIIGVMEIVDQAYGKVRIGQKVRMKFDNYPHQEFGQLVGEVTEISKIPSDQGYFVKVQLENALQTTYNKTIQYHPEMSGVAEVITEDLRLIERVFLRFRKIFSS